MSTVRTGIGWDSHRFIAGRPLILGGIRLEHDFGLDGHSDADVLTHAIMDALLGAAGLEDIGAHFPDDDGSYKDADSVQLLGVVVTMLAERGFTVANVDATIMMERPKVGARRTEMRERLAAALGLDPSRVNVKATTGEGMGFVGRREGVGALAIATLEQR